MKKRVYMIFVLVAVFGISLASHAETDVEKLAPELRVLLKKEMSSLQVGMQAIIPAYIAGDMKEISKIASQMKNSYILKQAMTEAQKHELHEKFPPSFLALDKQFHQYAGMLQHVSEEKHLELVGFYYSKLLESCVGCHSQFAPHRFPALGGAATEKSEKGHHH
ncbi:MAG: putative metal-binding protein [Lentisphaeria bacterium]|jgi:predicted metal-binding protein